MIKNQQALRTMGTVLFIFILCVIFIEPLRTRMNNIFSLRDRGELKEEEVIGSVVGYNPRVKEIQEALKSARFYSGPCDGFMGIASRRAIKVFQKAKGLQVTGRINQITFLALNRHSETVRPLPVAGAAEPAIPKAAPAAPAEEKKPQPLKAQAEHADNNKPKIQKPEIKQIQSALAKAGFYKGKIDGIMGAKTKEALKGFQKSKGLKADGVAGRKTWEELKKHLD
jgi:peptidoglycan hydrolase-like protein with peptidoglycan-binding domain